MAPRNSELLASLAFVTVTLYGLYHISRRSVPPLPPGPKKHPIFGNIRDIPKSFDYITYEQWGKDYNTDILQLQAAATSIVVLNSFEAANELFEKKSAIYSSRAQTTMMPELMGWKWLLSSMPYSERWKQGRSLLQRHFYPSNTELHYPRQLTFVRGMLLPRLLEGPHTVIQLIRHMVGGMSMSVTYGVKIQPVNDPFIELAEVALAGILEASVPGKFLVDSIPILKYVPESFPGAGFQKKARVWRQLQEDFREKPFSATLEALENGDARHSFATACLQDLSESDDATDREYQIELIKDTCAVVFAAGADTLSAAVETFFLAMLCYPEVQRKAQEELDRVLGGSRLPHFDDKPDLPYITALVKEILRWQPPTPIAIPHYASEEDIYKGYRIPKGSIMIGNAWAMLHNEEDYPDPMTFKPERFLINGEIDDSIRDPTTASFGFGRRVCPGSHIAVATIWLTAASVLSTFNIQKGRNDDGSEIEPSVQYLTGLVRHPKPFRCTFKVRSKQAEELIQNAEEQGLL